MITIGPKRRVLYLQTHSGRVGWWTGPGPANRDAFQTRISQELLELNDWKFNHIWLQFLIAGYQSPEVFGWHVSPAEPFSQGIPKHGFVLQMENYWEIWKSEGSLAMVNYWSTVLYLEDVFEISLEMGEKCTF